MGEIILDYLGESNLVILGHIIPHLKVGEGQKDSK